MRTVNQVLASARVQVHDPSRSWLGWCLAFVRTAWGIKPSGIPDANAAWRLAKYKHRTGRPPAGAPVYWAVGRFGHISLSTGDGRVYSNDIRRKGKIDLVPIEEVTRRWNATYRGWSEDYAGTKLPLAHKPNPKPRPNPAQRRRHKVARGETLSGIAGRYKTTVSRLAKLNGIDDPDLIQIGQVLKLP